MSTCIGLGGEADDDGGDGDDGDDEYSSDITRVKARESQY